MALTREQKEQIREARDREVRERLKLKPRPESKKVRAPGAQSTSLRLLYENGWEPTYALIAAVNMAGRGEWG